MPEAIVRPDHMDFDGKHYFRVGAEDVNVGSYGKKRKDLIHLPTKQKGDHVEVHSTLKLDGLQPRQVTAVDIDYKKSSKISAAGDGKIDVAGVPVKVTADASGSHHMDQQDNLKLIKLVLDMDEVAEQLNKKPAAVVDMIKTGHDARVVHQVFVVMEATLADSLDGAAAVNVGGGTTVNVININAAVKGEGNKTVTTHLTLSKGQVFAYCMLRFTDKAIKEFEHIKGDDLEKKPPHLTANHFTEDQYGHG